VDPAGHHYPPRPSVLANRTMSGALVYVITSPDSTVSEKDYHEWYDKEHLPARLKVPGIISALRFRSTEHKEWLACYDLDSPAVLESKEYLALEACPSANERALVPHVNMDSRVYKQIFSLGKPPLEPPKTVLVVEMTPYPSHEKEFHHYYETFHIPQMANIPGWVRSRRYELLAPLGTGACKFITLHEFDRPNAVDAEKQQSIKWRNEVIEIVAERARSIWEPYHAADEPSGTYIVYHEGIQFNVKIDGKEGAPVIALPSVLGTNLSIWDQVVEALTPHYRIIRYDQRGHGRTSQPTQNISFSELADDLAAILDYFKIPKLHAIVGVSMGALVAIDFASRFPKRVEKIVACGAAPYTTPDDKKQWQTRTDVIKEEDGVNKLADATTDRWFTTKFKRNPANKATLKEIRDRLADTAPSAFIVSGHAMDDYNYMGVAKELNIPTLLICGAQDIPLQGMKELAETIPRARLQVIEDCKHLPMVEQPERFIALLKSFI